MPGYPHFIPPGQTDLWPYLEAQAQRRSVLGVHRPAAAGALTAFPSLHQLMKKLAQLPLGSGKRFSP